MGIELQIHIQNTPHTKNFLTAAQAGAIPHLMYRMPSLELQKQKSIKPLRPSSHALRG